MKYLLTIDTEEAWDWSGPYPTSNFCVKHIARLGEFQDICTRFGAKPTYFVNHAVLADASSSAVIRDLSTDRAVEVGMHVHPWATPSFTRNNHVASRDTYLHNATREQIWSQLDLIYQALLGLGIQPTSFRGGRYSSGGEIHAFLRDRKFLADCSVVPFTNWDEDGAPDFRHRDNYPVRLAPEKPGDVPIWEIPLSMGFSRPNFETWARFFRAVERSPLRYLKILGVAERLGIVRKVWLNFEIGDQNDWTPFLLMMQRMKVPCITFTVHSSSLFRGPGPYTRSNADEERILEQIKKVLEQLNSMSGFEPATASEAAIFLEKHYAGHRNQSA